jgi:uncharacterized protein YndB with AHSA1/START domain
VFAWLVEPEKQRAWTDGSSPFPVDPSELRVGWRAKGSFPVPGGERSFEIELKAYDPPRELAYVETYDGGEATAHYRLAESAGATTVTVAASADQAAPVEDVPAQVEAQIARLPAAQRELAREQLANAMRHAAWYESTTNPQVEEAWAARLDAELGRLKELVERERER